QGPRGFWKWGNGERNGVSVGLGGTGGVGKGAGGSGRQRARGESGERGGSERGSGRAIPASGGAPPPPPPSDAAATATANATDVVETAVESLGIPYAWGGTGGNGFDCSGLIQYAYGHDGIRVPRVSRDQAKAGAEVAPVVEALRPGDILLFSARAGAG